MNSSGPTLCDPIDYTVHGILQVRILEWVAFPFSRGSSQPRDRTQVSPIAGGFFTFRATKEAQGWAKYGVILWACHGTDHPGMWRGALALSAKRSPGEALFQVSACTWFPQARAGTPPTESRLTEFFQCDGWFCVSTQQAYGGQLFAQTPV